MRRPSCIACYIEEGHILRGREAEFCGTFGVLQGFLLKGCIVENLLKNSHTEPQRFCRTAGAKPSFSGPATSSPKLIFSGHRFFNKIWGSLALLKGKKNTNVNKFGGLSRDWVGGKILFMCFSRVIAMVEKNT